jgi:ketosteroid isomerase-like protein
MKKSPKITVSPTAANQNGNVVWGYGELIFPDGPSGHYGITLINDAGSWYMAMHISNVTPPKKQRPREKHMNRRNILTLIAAAFVWVWIVLPGSNAVAQSAGDVEGVKAASTNFYAALAVLDNGEAMEKVWAHTPYVTYVGPRSKTIIVGWDAQKKYWEDVDKLFTQRDVTLSDQHIHVNGNMAYEMGQETGNQKLKDGSTPKLDYITTNVYEKIDGKWLIISHHVQPKPQ